MEEGTQQNDATQKSNSIAILGLLSIIFAGISFIPFLGVVSLGALLFGIIGLFVEKTKRTLAIIGTVIALISAATSPVLWGLVGCGLFKADCDSILADKQTQMATTHTGYVTFATPGSTKIPMAGGALNSDQLAKCQDAVKATASCNFSTGTQTGTGGDICSGQTISNFGVGGAGSQPCVEALFKQTPQCLADLEKNYPDCIVTAQSAAVPAASPAMTPAVSPAMPPANVPAATQPDTAAAPQTNFAPVVPTSADPQVNPQIIQKCRQAIQSVASCNYGTGTQTGTGNGVCTGQPIDNFGNNPVGTQNCVAALFKQYPACLEELKRQAPDCVVTADTLKPASK